MVHGKPGRPVRRRTRPSHKRTVVAECRGRVPGSERCVPGEYIASGPWGDRHVRGRDARRCSRGNYLCLKPAGKATAAGSTLVAIAIEPASRARASGRPGLLVQGRSLRALSDVRPRPRDERSRRGPPHAASMETARAEPAPPGAVTPATRAGEKTHPTGNAARTTERHRMGASGKGEGPRSTGTWDRGPGIREARPPDP
jgi:hypothetical protein